MKNTIKLKAIRRIAGIALVAIIIGFSFTACSGSGGGGKSLNSATELKEYLDKQPANSPDKPIKVAMKANEMMIKDIAKVISEAGKYVSLNLSGSPLTEIPDEAFKNCKTLSGITIPNSVTDIGDYAFDGCTSLTSITVESGNPNCTSEGGILYDKAKTTLILAPVGISGSVTIPDSVTGIGGGAFSGCTSLTSITIPNSVTYIGFMAFFRCASLTSVTIPNSVTYIWGFAFIECTSLTSVTFQGTIASDNLGTKSFGSVLEPFDGYLRNEYLTGGIGTYTRSGDSWYYTWTKQ
jgi:hypothetical protein